jgi:hypothetical protein
MSSNFTLSFPLPTSEATKMSSERPEQISEPPADDASCNQTTILIRGETIRDQTAKSPSKDSSSQKDSSSKESSSKESSGSDSAAKASSGKDQDSKNDSNSKNDPKAKEKEKPPVSEAKLKLQSRLPVLDGDADLGVQKEQVVTRDGKADLAFTGTLLASAAPPSAPKGEWDEYRIYETNAGKHVFSKVSRTISADEQDNYEAEVFDPSPSSMPSQLLRSARDLARSRPLTWTDAAVDFFGYDPLAKVLYRKLGGQFEEHIG